MRRATPTRAAARYSVEGDQTRPTVTISGPAQLQKGPFDVTFTFSESMKGFEKGDVTVGNGSVTAFSGSGLSYTATIAPAGDGTVTVDVAAHVATDATGNPNMPAKRYSVQAEASPNAPPVITNPGDKSYELGEAITAFDISASDADGDPLTVTVTGLPSGLSYASGQVSGTVAVNAAIQDYTVTISADDGVNAAVEETFTVSLSIPGASVPVTAGGAETETVTNDDGTVPALTISDATADEGDSLTFTVTLDKAVLGGLTVTPSFTDGTAAKGTDYTENTAGISFAGTAGETQTFTVSTTEDEVVEAAETFTVGLAVSETTQTVTHTDTATGTITDDDSAAVSISDASAGEGGSLTFTVTLDKAVQGGFTVTPGFTDGTATSGADYTANTAALTFAGTAGESRTFTVATTDDTDEETNETFTVGLSVSGTSLAVTATATATGTITDDDDDGLPTVRIFDASADEGGSMTFTVTVDEAVQGGFTVTPSFTDATAAKGTDYTENTAGIAFAGTKDEQHSFTVATTEDEVVEAGETFTIGLAVSGTTATVTATDTATGTITNDDTATVLIGSAASPEGTALSFALIVDKAVQGGFTVTPGFTDGTAEKGTDYTENTEALTFSGVAGQAQTFLVETTDDRDHEPDETFTVSLSISGTSLAVTAGGTATGTILDDDPRTLRATVNTPPVITDPGDKTYEQGEEITAFDITVTDANAADQVTVTVTGLPSGLSYASGQVSGTVAVNAAIQDYTVTISADDGVNTAVTETFTIKVTPHWNRPTVDITGPTVPQKEKFNVRIIFSEQVSGFTKSDVTVGNGSVTFFSGADDSYDAEITPAATGTVTVDVPANVAEDGAEYGNAAAPRYSVEADFDAPTVSISGPTASQSDSFDVTITFSESVTGFAQGDVTVSGGSATALSGSGASYTATITPTATGTLTVDVAANVAEDQAGHGNTAASQFSVTAALTRPTVVISGPAGVQTGAFTVNIDFSETVTGFAQADVTVGNGRVTGWAETNGTALVIITPSASGTVTVDVAANVATDSDSNGNTAAVQYSVQANVGEPTVTIDCPSGLQTGRFTVDIDFSEAVTGFVKADVTVSNGRVTGWAETNGDTLAIITPSASGTVTIGVPANVATDSDGYGNLAAQSCSVQTDLSSAPAVTVAGASAAEGDAITFTVTLDQAVNHGLTVTPSFTDGTAEKGTDYTANTAALAFTGTAGETKTFTVATTEDDVVEYGETFTVGLVVSKTSATVSADDTATGTITNDDTATVTVSDGSASEETGGEGLRPPSRLFYTVTIDKEVQGGITLTPNFPDSQGIGTASSRDFHPTYGRLTGFGQGNFLSHELFVDVKHDEIVEGTETFTIALAVSDAPSGVTATDTGTGTIIDNDSASVTIADASAVEGDAITFTATLDKAVVGGFTVTPGFADGTAVSGTDYTGNTAAAAFAGNAGETKTFTVATTEDADEETNETFTVSLSLSGTSLAVTAADTAAGTIIDDDGPTSVTVTDASAAEGGSMTFTVTLNQAVTGGFTVTPSFTDVTATSGTDYTENTAALSFTGNAGETKTFTVATTADQLVEAAETFTVGLTVSGTQAPVAATDTATGTITDDDSASVTISDASADEGGSITFTVTLDNAVPGGLTVTPGFTDVTAASGTDYTENTAALAFTGTAGETKNFTVATTEDTDEETDETFTVSLSVSETSLAVTATDTATGTIIDDDDDGVATVTISDASAGEGDTLAFTVSLDQAVSGGFTVTPSFAGGTAAKGTDYTANTAGLAFAGTEGETQTLTVATTQDEVVELDETFTVGLAVSGTSVTVTATDTATGTITNDDTATVTVEAVSVGEGGPGHGFVIDGIRFTEVSTAATLDKACAGGASSSTFTPRPARPPRIRTG